MHRSEGTYSSRKLNRGSTALFLLGWTAAIALSLFWNLREARLSNLEKARIEARALFELNLVYRRWAAQHGGVYVPVTDTLQPNPYLNVPNRDVTTTGGRKLTLMNPAWMTRQVFDLLSTQSDLPVINHLTSLKYLNPVNKPDAWEESVLREFEKGKREGSVTVTRGDQPYMRLMKPFITEEPCLRCHSHQGYKVGDVRGGISIAVPLAPHLANMRSEQRTAVVSHSLIWSIGAGFIVLFLRRLSAQQERTQAGELQYRLLFESNPHPMWVYDRHTLRFLTVNDIALARYGYSREEFLAMTIKDIRPSEDIPRLLDNVARVIPGVIDEAGVWRHRKKDGTIIYVEITSHALNFEGREAELVLAHEVTDRLRLEAQFRQAQKMEAVGLLAGGVAHDFNNILTAIIGYANLIQMKMQPDDPSRPHIEQVLASAERAAGLTRSLLAFSRRQLLNPAPVNGNEIIRKIESLLRRIIGEDIDLRTSLSNDDVTILADSIQIEQILMNLATNARDAMPKGGMLMIATARQAFNRPFRSGAEEGQAGDYVRITVSDTGQGMDEETRQRIFEPFFTTKEVGKGTGLGLATVYGIVKQHNGLIDVASRPGDGTTFTMLFPAVHLTPSLAEAEAGESPRRGTETVLIAEDDDVIRNLTRIVLESYGYRVLEAVNGEEAVRLFFARTEPVHLLLFDVIMPKKSGKDAAEEILAQAPEIPVLFISGYSADLLRKRDAGEHTPDFIAKPVSPRALLLKVREVLDRGKPAATA